MFGSGSVAQPLAEEKLDFVFRSFRMCPPQLSAFHLQTDFEELEGLAGALLQDFWSKSHVPILLGFPFLLKATRVPMQGDQTYAPRTSWPVLLSGECQMSDPT
jgi:hypothetical protein